MKIPIVKEYGSWAVFIFSCAAGIITGLLTQPWKAGRSFSPALLFTVLGLVFLINAKSPLSLVLRTKVQRKENLLWFLFFSLGGFILLIPFLSEDIKTFLFFLPLVLSYIVLLSLGKEHYLITELNGFALLTLSAPISYSVVAGEMSLKLYIAVFIFFAAGVFKVKARMKKTLVYRWLMVFYCAGVLMLFSYLHISAVVILPLLENILSVLWLREEKLRTTGNTELIKGIIFTTLLASFWQ